MLKNLKNWDTENNYCYGPKIEKFSFFSAVKQLKDAMIKVNSIDPDHTTTSGAVCSEPAEFV